MAHFEKTLFCLESIKNNRFPGYSNGDTWNGFACPFFEKSIAESILDASKMNGYYWSYDAKRDVYVVSRMEDYDEFAPEEFAGQVIDVNANEINLYPIGAYSWIWGTCE